MEAALRLEVARFTHATDIPCELKLKELDSIPEDVQELLIRNISEGLTNIARHAQARRVNVQVSKEDNKLKAVLEDDGCGFDMQNIPPGHYGLIGMRERIRSLGGEITITSEISIGTRLEMRIPL